jgi:tetratricopeptide (TPR) repeat protein
VTTPRSSAPPPLPGHATWGRGPSASVVDDFKPAAPTVPDFDRQLGRLFGESLFGPWLDPGQYLAATRTTRRHGTPFKRLALVAFAVGVLAAAGWIVRAGLSRRTGEDRAQVANSLATFLREGELDRAAQFVALLRGPSPGLDPQDPQLDLIVRGEATLYRHQDADPARLARIKPYLSTADSASAQRILASLAVASRQERAVRLSALESIRAASDRDPEFHYLLASALEHKGDVPAARQAWARAFELGPLWLGHRYEQAWFEARYGKPEAIAKQVSSLTRVAPNSAWTRLAVERFGSARTAAPVVATSASAAPPTPAVALFHRLFALALDQVRAGDPVAARRNLSQAIDAVNGQATFIFDAFDWLVASKAMGLAREMTAFESWPRHSEPAAARLASVAEPVLDKQPAVSEAKDKSKKSIKKSGPGKSKKKARHRK